MQIVQTSLLNHFNTKHSTTKFIGPYESSSTSPKQARLDFCSGLRVKVI